MRFQNQSSSDGRIVVAGDFGSLLYSADGGVNWSIDSLGSTDDFVGLAFSGRDSGLAVGRTGSLAQTYDGRRTWRSAEHVGSLGAVARVIAVEPRKLLLINEAGSILLSQDFGRSWREVVSGGRRLNGITSRSGVVVACGDSGTVLRSRDGGINWEMVPVPTAFNLHGADMSDDYSRCSTGISLTWRFEHLQQAAIIPPS